MNNTLTDNRVTRTRTHPPRKRWASRRKIHGRRV